MALAGPFLKLCDWRAYLCAGLVHFMLISDWTAYFI
jgi:hypothetical protein